MLHSFFLHHLFDLLLVEDREPLRAQLPFLSLQGAVAYTGAGAFYCFRHEAGIETFRSEVEQAHINGVVIRSPELEHTAEAIVHVSAGLIDHL